MEVGYSVGGVMWGRVLKRWGTILVWYCGVGYYGGHLNLLAPGQVLKEIKYIYYIYRYIIKPYNKFIFRDHLKSIINGDDNCYSL